MKRKANLFDKMGTLIPGYTGYQAREGRRECDRQLRDKISDKLYEIEKQINFLIEKSEFNSLADTEKIRKKINNLKDLIKYSPYGASSLFSDSAIKENELEEIYQLDLNVFHHTENLQKGVTNENMDDIKHLVQSVENSINERNLYLKDL